MKKIKILLTLFIFLALMANSTVKAQPNEYVVVVNSQLKSLPEWTAVYTELADYHKAKTIYYDSSFAEVMKELKKLKPRYVAIVAHPENINRGFVTEVNRLSRMIDDDIYADFMWGIITGYSAGDALRIVRQSQQPFTIKSALSTTSEVSSGIWFDRFVWLDDGTKGVWGEKLLGESKPTSYETDPYQLLKIFSDKYTEIDPDLIITSSHGTQSALEMPFSTGTVRSKKGKLYADFFQTKYLPTTNKPRVYAPIGNCLIGDVNGSDESIAVAWLSSGGVTALAGYVVETWYGRNGWGGLKYWVKSPGLYTFPEAMYLNVQGMLTHEYRDDPRLLTIQPNVQLFGGNITATIEYELKNLFGEIDEDRKGYIYDRDVIAYYGDPKWNVRLQSNPEITGFSVKYEEERDTYTLVINTNQYFTNEKAKGAGFKEQHVGDLPLGFYLPKRLSSPSLASGQEWDAVVNEDFVLLYNTDLEPNSTYRVVLKVR